MKRQKKHGREKFLLMPVVKVLAAGSESINQTDEGIKKDSFTALVSCHFPMMGMQVF